MDRMPTKEKGVGSSGPVSLLALGAAENLNNLKDKEEIKRIKNLIFLVLNGKFYQEIGAGDELLHANNLLIAPLLNQYPTIEDIKRKMSKLIKDQISVEKTTYDQNKQKELENAKKELYNQALIKLIEILQPIYDEIGAVKSDKNKERILENIRSFADYFGGRKPAADQKAVSEFTTSDDNLLEESIKAAAKQDLRKDEAIEILKAYESYLNFFQFGPDSRNLKIGELKGQIENLQTMAGSEIFSKQELDALLKK